MRESSLRRVSAISVALGPGLIAVGANAESVEPTGGGRVAQPRDGNFHFNDRPVTFDGVVGFGTPVGLVGAVVQYDVARWFTLGGGAGTNIAGLQVAALSRFRAELSATPKRASALAFGVAFASGPFGRSPDLLNVDHSYGTSYVGVGRMDWVQMDAGIEFKARSGFHLLWTAGLALPLEPGRGHCEDRNTGARTSCYDVDPGEVPGNVFTITLMIGSSI